MSLFDSLFAFSASHQSQNAKRKPFQLSIKIGEQSVKVKITGEIDKASADELVTLAHSEGIEVSFKTPLGAAALSRPFSLDTEPAAALTSAVIAGNTAPLEEMEETETIPDSVKARGENVIPNGQHA